MNVCVSVPSLFGPVFRITCTVSAVVGARSHSIGNITMFIVPTGVPSTLNKKCPSLHIVAVVLAVCDQIESKMKSEPFPTKAVGVCIVQVCTETTPVPPS